MGAEVIRAPPRRARPPASRPPRRRYREHERRPAVRRHADDHRRGQGDTGTPPPTARRGPRATGVPRRRRAGRRPVRLLPAGDVGPRPRPAPAAHRHAARRRRTRVQVRPAARRELLARAGRLDAVHRVAALRAARVRPHRARPVPGDRRERRPPGAAHRAPRHRRPGRQHRRRRRHHHHRHSAAHRRIRAQHAAQPAAPRVAGRTLGLRRPGLQPVRLPRRDVDQLDARYQARPRAPDRAGRVPTERGSRARRVVRRRARSGTPSRCHPTRAWASP